MFAIFLSLLLLSLYVLISIGSRQVDLRESNLPIFTTLNCFILPPALLSQKLLKM